MRIPPKVHRRATLALALGAALTVSGCLGYDGDFERGYQVDQDTLSQVKVGATTKPEALALLGTPSTTSTVGGDAWYYIGQKMKHTLSFMPVQMTDQHVLAVYFDKSGKVDRIANYGMKDGKVFDFVSRTTPTGGSEPDFLKNIMGGLFKFT
jgi:outer membrane protein assembly factor BamE (lipoprotein component of BamABCDE complex)